MELSKAESSAKGKTETIEGIKEESLALRTKGGMQVLPPIDGPGANVTS
mgnify:CR=1 FL=1